MKQDLITLVYALSTLVHESAMSCVSRLYRRVASLPGRFFQVAEPE